MGHKLLISREAYSAIRAASHNPTDDAVPTRDGWGVIIDVSAETHSRLAMKRQGEETLSDTIIRLVSLATKGLN